MGAGNGGIIGVCLGSLDFEGDPSWFGGGTEGGELLDHEKGERIEDCHVSWCGGATDCVGHFLILWDAMTAGQEVG